METSTAFLVFGIIAAALILLIPVLIGIYVYKDAKSRGMDAVLWTLVAVLIPGLIGLIIYLVIRSNNPKLNCPSCKKPIAAEYALCPYCGLPLIGTCPSCQFPISGDWKLCPKCGAELSPGSTSGVDTAPKKDRKLAALIIAVIVVPVLIFAVSVGGLVMFRYGTSSGMMSGGSAIRAEDGKVYAPVASWMEECDRQGKGAYVLEMSDEQAEAFYFFTNQHKGMALGKETYAAVIYLNQYKGTHEDIGFFGGNSEHFTSAKKVVVEYETTNIATEKIDTDYVLDYVVITGDRNTALQLILKIDGDEAPYQSSRLE